MNITTSSPSLVLLYVFALLWILMGVEVKSLTRTQRCVIPVTALLLAGGNHLLRELLGPTAHDTDH